MQFRPSPIGCTSNMQASFAFASYSLYSYCIYQVQKNTVLTGCTDINLSSFTYLKMLGRAIINGNRPEQPNVYAICTNFFKRSWYWQALLGPT